MTMLIDIRAFLSSARFGSFSAAARDLGTMPSVISKRVGRLEEEIGATLFRRSTRNLTLTADGERLRPRLQQIVAELDDALHDRADRRLRGTLRLRTTTTFGTDFVGPAVNRFQVIQPEMAVELMLIDRPVNPLEEGFDVSLGAVPQSWGGVAEIPICPYPRVLVAAASYLERRRPPQDPGDLIDHDCLAFANVGHTWTFEGPRGPISVDIRGRFMVNASSILVDAAIRGLGVAIVPTFMAQGALDDGRLVHLLPAFPPVKIWFKAMVPRHKMARPDVQAFLDHIRAEFDPPPWERDRQDLAEESGCRTHLGLTDSPTRI